MIIQEKIRKRKLEKKHLNYLIYNDLNEMMFCDFINIAPFLYDGINIDENTINIINNNFMLYYLEPQSFYLYFRNKLTLILPTYFNMIKNEMREELFNLSNNTNYRRLANAKIDDLINEQTNKNKSNRTNQNTSNGENTSTSSSSNNSKQNNQQATKDNPFSIEGEDFESLFDWSSSSNITESENKNNTTSTDNSSGTNKNTQNITEDIKNEAKNNIKQLTHSLTDQAEINDGASILAVEAIEKIAEYLMKQNKSFDYLIKQLKPLFINCE